MRKNKAVILFSTIGIALLVSYIAYACGSNINFNNATTAGTHFTGWTTFANVQGAFWAPGLGNPTVGAGTDNGLYPATTGSIKWANDYSATQPNAIYIFGNWNQTAPATATDTCPTVASDAMTILLYEQTGDGTAAHSGKFVVATTPWATTKYDFSAAMTPSNNKAMQAIPVPDVTSSTNNGNGTFTFNLSWTLPAAGVSQYYRSTMAAPTVITGWDVYYVKGGTSAPITGNVASWTFLATVAGGGTTTYAATVTYDPATENQLYFALRPRFDSNFVTPFVGANSPQIGPTAAPLFSSVTADTASVNWTSGVETRVASYQVYWAPSLTDTFKAVGLSIPALGDNQTYSATYRVVTTAPSYYVKVKASKTDGTFEYSAPVLVQKTTKTTPDSIRPIVKRTK